MKKALLVSLPLALLLTACPFYGYKYNTGHFPEAVINFEEVNSEFDDYNSTAPEIWDHQLFHFSSNRNSQGGEFDIVGEDMLMVWNKDDGDFSMLSLQTEDRFDYLHPMFDSVNTSSDELGPYSIGYRKEISYSQVIWTDLMMFASDADGDFDIKFITALLNNYGYSDSEEEIGEIYEIDFLNTGANDLYPCFSGESFYYNNEYGLDPSLIERILWCSDAGGNFDIMQMDFNSGDSLIAALLIEQAASPEPVPGLNSEADDKCPFANGELLVFASDREGGHGGFDLYYCLWNGEGWGEPVNFGDEINSSADEYRPITFHHHEFDNNLLVFSSNREGGKGGFDLYYTGIKQMVRP